MRRIEGEVYSKDMRNGSKKIVCISIDTKANVTGYEPAIIISGVPSWILWLVRSFSQEV